MKKLTLPMVLAMSLTLGSGTAFADRADDDYEVKGTIQTYKDGKLTIALYNGKTATYTIPAGTYVDDKYNVGFTAGMRVELEMNRKGTIYEVELKPAKKKQKAAARSRAS